MAPTATELTGTREQMWRLTHQLISLELQTLNDICRAHSEKQAEIYVVFQRPRGA